MPYEQVRHILRAVQAFHAELGRIFDSHSQSTGDEQLRLLMDVVGRHERQFAAAFDRYEESGDVGVLNTWLQYAPMEEIQQSLRGARLANSNSLGEIAEVLWEFEKSLNDLYVQLAEATSASRVQELFESLRDVEQAKTGMYAWSLCELQNLRTAALAPDQDGEANATH